MHEAAAELDELSTFTGGRSPPPSLDDQLAGDGPFTIFAPSNAAMSEIPTNVLDSMLADPDLLDSILSYHIVVGEALPSDDAGRRDRRDAQRPDDRVRSTATCS